MVGANPPFHTPVFVLTHHPRPSIEMEGGTVFHFVDASPQEALDLAREAAGDLDVRIGGGPTVVRDFLAADLIDSLHLVLVPIVLGRGVRLLDASRASRSATTSRRSRHRAVSPPDLHAPMTDPADGGCDPGAMRVAERRVRARSGRDCPAGAPPAPRVA